MLTYQIYLNGSAFDVPFEVFNEAAQLVAKIATPFDYNDFTIKEREIVPGNYYRRGNSLYMKDVACKGILKGVYYSHNPLHL